MELRGDFRQFYGLDFADAGSSYSHEYAADLAATLPRESRIARAANPANEWSAGEYMLANIEYAANWIAWSRTKDAKHGLNRPKRRQTPLEAAKVRSKLGETDLAEIDSILGYA